MRVILDERELSYTRMSFAIAFALGLLLTFRLIVAWTPEGGCDGGLCALSLIPQLGYAGGMWLFNLLALVIAWMESKQPDRSSYTSALIMCGVTMTLPVTYFLLVASDFDEFDYILIPIILPPFIYAMLLFTACLIGRIWLRHWEDLSEDDILD